MNPLLNGMNDRQAEAVQTTEGPLLIMAGLVLVRHVSWPIGLLTWSMKKWSILGIFWPLPLPIKPLGRWRSGLISWIQPPKTAWLPPSTLCVCASSVVMRITLATIAILPLSTRVSNGPWWSASWSPWTWILKMEWTDHLGDYFQCQKWPDRWSGLRRPGWRYVHPDRRQVLWGLPKGTPSVRSSGLWWFDHADLASFWSASRCADLLPAEVPIHPCGWVSRYQPCPIPVGQTLGFTF